LKTVFTVNALLYALVLKVLCVNLYEKVAIFFPSIGK